MVKLLIGIISYNDLPLLRKSLPILLDLSRDLQADCVLLDNAWDEEVKGYVEGLDVVQYLRHEEGNIGYARGYNYILGQGDGYDLYLIVTSDVLLNPEVVRGAVELMEREPDLVQCAGKLHVWDEAIDERTRFIDSCGIWAEPRHHFFDLGQGELDEGQHDSALEAVFGVSGATFLIRTSVVEGLGRELGGSGIGGALFDERMWMYKEDVDLAYRLRWLGAKITVLPEVWGWHIRSVSNKGGRNVLALARADSKKPAHGRFQSYGNHLLMLKNNLSIGLGFGVLLRVLVYEFFKGFYVLLRSPRAFFRGMRMLFFVSAHRVERRVDASYLKEWFA